MVDFRSNPGRGKPMGSLKDHMETIIREISAYARPPLNGGESYLTRSADGKLLSVVDVLPMNGQHQADTGLVVRIAGEFIIIEHDMNNKPLVDALVQAGVPRTQIILAYAGEPLPATI
jgi:XisI protein